MKLDEELREFLEPLLWEYAAHIQVNQIDQQIPPPFVFLRRTGNSTESLLDGTKVWETTSFVIECVADDLETAIDMGDTLRDELNGYSGTWGDKEIKWVEVSDTQDDYLPRADADEGRSICSLNLEITNI